MGAKAISDHTVNIYRDNTVGTLNYMSPEAFGNNDGDQSNNPNQLKKLGRPADVWSLGCVLHKIVHGFTPFTHMKNTWMKIFAIVGKTPWKITEHECAHVNDIIRQCLQKDPASRPTLQQLLKHPFL